MSVKILAQILLYKRNKHLYTEAERRLIKKEFYNGLDIGIDRISDTLLDIIDKINDD